MNFARRHILQNAVAAAAAVSIAPCSVWGLDYPVRPIRLVVGFLPGSAADTVARIMTHWLSQELKQPVIIENKAGAATNIATQSLISSPPDGYTLGLIGSSNAANATLFDSLPFNVLQETVPVAGLFRLPMVMVAGPTVPPRRSRNSSPSPSEIPAQ